MLRILFYFVGLLTGVVIPGSRLRPDKPVANIIDCILVYIK